MFVKSFPDPNGQNPSPLIRMAIIAIGPMVWNACVLLTLFFFSLALGPVLTTYFPKKFATSVAFVAHFSALIGIVAFFEFFVSTELLLSILFR